MNFTTKISDFNQFLSALKPNKIFFLVDENTHEKCFPNLLADLPELGEYEILEIEPGEENKSLEVAANLWLSLAELGAERNDVIVNVGGGVVTDLGGFIASTYKRGMPFVNVPTSLLAMVDAAHGGKTGVDLANIKNLVGNIVNAEFVYTRASFLETLPNNQLKSGFAEMLKHGLITDAEHWRTAVKEFPKVSDALIRKSVELKLGIVEQDPTEKSVRKILNFGHTIGHAIESYLLDRGMPVLHGEAVAAGMIMEANLSTQYSGLSDDEYSEVRNQMDAVFKRIALEHSQVDEVMTWLKFDKKNKNGICQFTLLKEIGVALYNVEVEMDDIKIALQDYLK